MESLRRLLWTSLVLGFVAMNLFGCSDSGSSTATIPTNRLYMAAAEDGTLSPTENADEYVLTLNNVQPDMLWFTNRPERESGEETVEGYVRYVWPGAYGEVPPNAVMKFYVSGTNAGVFVTLKAPEYDSDAGTLKFQATMLNFTFDVQPDGILAFEAPVITVLDNASERNSISTFVMYGEYASFDVATAEGQYGAATEGQYTLTQYDLDNKVLQANNAPGRYSKVSTTESFVDEWNSRFSDSPPNACIFGLTESGELEAYLVTLSDPKYEKVTNLITYSATVLGQEAGNPGQLYSATLVIDNADGLDGPVMGVTYHPAPWSCPTCDGGGDWANDDTANMWDDGGTNRGDLKRIADAGFNAIRLYTWDPAKSHINFLNKCHALGLSVMVGIQNDKLSIAEEVVKSTFVNGKIHPAVKWFGVGNELDVKNKEVQKPALEKLVDMIQNKILPNTIKFTAPVTTDPKYAAALNYYKSVIDAKNPTIYKQNYFASINSYQYTGGAGWPGTGPVGSHLSDPSTYETDIMFTEASWNIISGSGLGGCPSVVSYCPLKASLNKCQGLSDAGLVADTLNHFKYAQKPVPAQGFLGLFVFNYVYERWKSYDGYNFSLIDMNPSTGELCPRLAWQCIADVIKQYKAGQKLTQPTNCSLPDGQDPDKPIQNNCGDGECPDHISGCQAEYGCCFVKKEKEGDTKALSDALGWVCGQGIDCKPINQGGDCFNLDLVGRCNYAFNAYWYQGASTKPSVKATRCNFSGVAEIQECSSVSQSDKCKGCPGQ